MRLTSVRRITALLFIAAASVAARATPIVVMKTETGYIVATNGRNEIGERWCKLQYNNSEVTLHGSANARHWAANGEKDFDMNEVLWAAYKAHPAYVSRHQLALALDQAVAARATELRDVGEFFFRLVTVAVGHLPASSLGVRPDGIQIDPLNRREWTWFDEGPLHSEFGLRVGEALVWAASELPLKKTGSPTLAGVWKLLDEAIPPGHEGDFGPPYLIGRLDSQGFRFITSDEGICTVAHPAPIVEEDTRLLRKRKPRPKRP